MVKQSTIFKYAHSQVAKIVQSFDKNNGIAVNIEQIFHKALPIGRDALSEQSCELFVAKAGSKLCLQPGQKVATQLTDRINVTTQTSLPFPQCPLRPK